MSVVLAVALGVVDPVRHGLPVVGELLLHLAEHRIVHVAAVLQTDRQKGGPEICAVVESPLFAS